MNTRIKRTSTGLKSLSVAGILGFIIIAGSTSVMAQSRGGGGGGGGGSPGGGDGGNANYGRAPWQDAAVLLAPNCDGRVCPPIQKKVPILTPADQGCGGVPPLFDRQGKIINRSCEQQLTQAQLNKLKH